VLNVEQEPRQFFPRCLGVGVAIQGIARLGKEIASLHRNFDRVVAPIGGGALASGIVVGLRDSGNRSFVVGAESLAANDAVRSKKERSSRRRPRPKPSPTVPATFVSAVALGRSSIGRFSTSSKSPKRRSPRPCACSSTSRTSRPNQRARSVWPPCSEPQLLGSDSLRLLSRRNLQKTKSVELVNFVDSKIVGTIWAQ
jgi:hypothetical protein